MWTTKIDFSKKLDKPSDNVFAQMFNLNTTNKNKENATEIDLNLIVPFKNHPFRLYTGEKLRQMVESIKKNGVIVPMTGHMKTWQAITVLMQRNLPDCQKFLRKLKKTSQMHRQYSRIHEEEGC
ncbi:hypothetical protein [Ruminiclostridium papyrosolvens]|uniref:ParB/Sulfiredoxin domain-containing protein n=1 Tax=Ruminiclostridium papyrosolvens C7 TaxID=1330534 RepID=U4R1U9_9FIRM|nr:hypothetical protein L323_11605 [Ruminiclostridium papyrosolvens C7]